MECWSATQPIQAANFHATWNARLGLQVKPGFLKAHWLRIKALARRMGEGWSDEYLDLKPIADMHKELQESIYRFIQSPAAWTGPVPSDDEKQVLFEALAMIISLRLLVVVAGCRLKSPRPRTAAKQRSRRGTIRRKLS